MPPTEKHGHSASLWLEQIKVQPGSDTVRRANPPASLFLLPADVGEGTVVIYAGEAQLWQGRKASQFLLDVFAGLRRTGDFGLQPEVTDGVASMLG